MNDNYNVVRTQSTRKLVLYYEPSPGPKPKLTRSHSRDVNNYTMLVGIVNSDIQLCTRQMTKICEFLDDQDLLKEEKKQAEMDLKFLTGLLGLLQFLKDQKFPEDIPSICRNVVLYINSECRSIRSALNIVKIADFVVAKDRHAFQKLFINGVADPYKKEKCQRAEKSLLALENIKKMYLPNVLYIEDNEESTEEMPEENINQIMKDHQKISRSSMSCHNANELFSALDLSKI